MDNLEFAKKMEKRTEDFADKVFYLCREIPSTPVNKEIVIQLTKAAGSVGANYIEANESLSKKDFFHRIRISRKESKESRYWLKRLLKQNPGKVDKINPLIKEASEFVLIFSKIVTKS